MAECLSIALGKEEAIFSVSQRKTVILRNTKGLSQLTVHVLHSRLYVKSQDYMNHLVLLLPRIL